MNDHAPAPPLKTAIVAALLIIGIGLTLWLYYPGIMTFDAAWIYGDVRAGRASGDWQSPAMAALWSLIDRVVPGTVGMFILIAALYWLSYGILAFRVAARSLPLAVVLLLLALSPPAFLLIGFIWRDILMAHCWLLAAVLAYLAPDFGKRARIAVQATAMVLAIYGLLLRPNALFAAPLLAAYVIWPGRIDLRRIVYSYIPAVVVGFGLINIVFYGILGATRQHVSHSILVFDLGGISYFTGENQYPLILSPSESKLLFEQCYDPSEWDSYWMVAPCRFVMRRLEDEKIFGSSTLVNAWVDSVSAHPIAYLQHRFSHMFALLTIGGRTANLEAYDQVNKGGPSLKLLIVVYNALKYTILFRIAPWFLLCIAVFAFAWRRRNEREGAYAAIASASAIIYIATFLFFGVASEFRYAYWAVLAGLTGAVLLMLPRPVGEPTPAGAAMAR